MTKPPIVNIYCDESAHLQHSPERYMLLGGVTCAQEDTRRVADSLRNLKEHHGLWRQFEVKWTKVSPGKMDLYRDLLEFFFTDDALSFRVLVADKTALRHEEFEQTHDDWYYKMYYTLLRPLLRGDNRFRVYLDIKSTRGGEKVRRLHEVLANKLRDFRREKLERIQQVRSHEVEQLQLADLLIGAVGYANRGEFTSSAKAELVEMMRARSGLSLQHTTGLRRRKVNVFCWVPQEADGDA